MSAYARGRALDRIAEVAGRGHDVVTFWEEVTELMTPVVPHYMGPCWYTLDPASLLMTSHFNPAMPELPREWLELEVVADASTTSRPSRAQTPAFRRCTTRPGESQAAARVGTRTWRWAATRS